MKSLTLFRHAKSESDSSTGRDFDRMLADRGREDATKMGAEMRKLGLAFDLVLASPARRSAETVERAALLSPRFDGRIYDAPAKQLLGIVQQVDDVVDRLLLVGHNPGFERLASHLIGKEIEMSTGSLVEIALPTDRWRNTEERSGRLACFIEPSQLA